MRFGRKWLLSLRALRIILVGTAALTAVLATLVLVHQFILPVLAILIPSLRTSLYDIAVYGRAPTRKYHSSDLLSPDLSVLKWHNKCGDGGHIFIAPYGKMAETPGPMILDDHGNLIWTSPAHEDVTNFQIQEYKGEQVLTFWSGHKEGAKGNGAVHILNSRYEIIHIFQAVGDELYADMHEFQLTSDGTALITVFNDTAMDMRDFGLLHDEHGWVTDCLFQEIDVETNELLFQWVASEHVRPADSHYFQLTGGYSASEPLDYFHINSIEKDSRGNYLISSRHFHTVTYVEGGTGDVLWTLGTDSADFVDISAAPGAATKFCWSHDARWIDEETGILSLFDNGNAGPLHPDHWSSKGMFIQIDQERRTVKHLQDFNALHQVRSHSQGNLQFLPEKHEVIIGWGGAAMWTQHDLNGELLCEVHFGPVWLSYLQNVMSYRVFKAWGWKGDPQWPPSASIFEGSLYMSWNGATELASWRIEGWRTDGKKEDGNFETIDVVEKVGFETAFRLPGDGFSLFRVVALDALRNDLAYSDAVKPVEWEMLAGPRGRSTGALLVISVICLTLFLLLRRLSLRSTLSWRQREHRPEYKYSKL